MIVNERCICGANFSVEEIHGDDINSTVRLALADFRSGHACTSGPAAATPKPAVPF